MYNDNIKLFSKQYSIDKDSLKYNAGVCMRDSSGKYVITSFQNGAEDLFSVGQPIYDGNDKLLGYLSVRFFDNLCYSYENQIGVNIPVETWVIDNPTSNCGPRAFIKTFWHKLAESSDCIIVNNGMIPVSYNFCEGLPNSKFNTGSTYWVDESDLSKYSCIPVYSINDRDSEIIGHLPSDFLIKKRYIRDTSKK